MDMNEYRQAFAAVTARADLAKITAQDPDAPIDARASAIEEQGDCLQETMRLLLLAARGEISAPPPRAA